MKKRNYSHNKSVQRVKHERDPIPWRYCLLTLICGLFLVVGFFFAARQHFAAIDFGIKNSKLRKQLDDLEDEKRRLVLAKEFAVSPTEIIKAAKKIGFSQTTASLLPFNGQTSKNENVSIPKPIIKPDEKASPNVQSFSGKPIKTEVSAVKTVKNNKPEKEINETKTPDRTTDKKGQNLR